MFQQIQACRQEDKGVQETSAKIPSEDFGDTLLYTTTSHSSTLKIKTTLPGN